MLKDNSERQNPHGLITDETFDYSRLKGFLRKVDQCRYHRFMNPSTQKSLIRRSRSDSSPWRIYSYFQTVNKKRALPMDS